MAETMVYGNSYGEEITHQEFITLKDYSLIYKEDGIVKRVDYYRDNKLRSHLYYRGNDESLPSVVEKYKNSNIEIVARSVVGNYVVEEGFWYIEEFLRQRSKRLYDNFGKELCEQHCESDTGEPILKKTEKYLFSDPDSDTFTGFDYDESGAVRSIWGDMVGNTDQSRKGSIYGDRILIYFPDIFIKYPYYQNADFMPAQAV